MKKMENFKKIASLVLALTMILCMGINAFAYTIKINPATTEENKDDTREYEYEAYQIFAGDLSDGKLSNIEWGSGIVAESTVNEVKSIWRTETVEGETTNFNIYAELAAISTVKDNEPVYPFNKVVDNTSANLESAAEVADILGGYTNDHAVAQAFADVVAKYLTTTTEYTSTAVMQSDNEETTDVNESTFVDYYEIATEDAGYYLVQTTEVPDADTELGAGSYTRYMLTVVKDTEVTHKGTVPTVDKDILENNANTDENEASIGDIITYEWEGTLPSNIAAYDTYFYKFTDTMSAGLTLTDHDENTDGIQSDINVVLVNGNDRTDVTKYFYISYVETKDEDNTVTGTNIVVGIEDLLVLRNADTADNPVVSGYSGTTIDKDTKVIVTYTAKLNENAVVGVEGNENKVNLEYSNDPNDDGDGANTPPPPPSEEPPTPDVPTGKTPDSVVYTYTTELIIKKTDGDGNILKGAAFKITGDGVNVVVTTGDVYVEDAEGTYYKLKDGTYTTTVPVETDDPGTTDVNEKNSDAYESTTIKYALKTIATIETDSTTSVNAEAFVNSEGVIKFTGLGAGTYTITETVTPVGYNSIDDFEVTIVWSAGTTAEDCIWTYTGTDYQVDEDGEFVFDSENNKIGTNQVTVVNKAGSTLPETGGIGTTIFYICGGVLLVGAAVLLITKRRMNIDG